MKNQIHMRLNNHPVEFLCETTDTLLYALRNSLQMTGTKEGCGSGDCGACSVILNGTLVCSCLVLAVECVQADVRTVEGLADGDALHPLQQALLDHAALQCGICTPGILLAASALLDKNPHPTETDVRYGIAGNLCRCTGYDKIVRAIMDVAQQSPRPVLSDKELS